MSRIIFDIETVGKDFSSFDSSTQDYLLRWTETEKEKELVKESLSFYPLTGEIVTIGMLNPDSMKGAVYFYSEESLLQFEEDGIRFESGTEKEMIEKFWNTIKAYDQFITFNGRTFDCPFIMVRSAVNKVKPTRHLMPNRYHSTHMDLLDILTFYGASKRRFNLDMWCKTFGIKSPKSDGITGYEVKGLFESGRYVDIARYCMGDLKATAELLFVWENYIKVS
ncbi:ribonuclease H-like domain-containing protein [Thermodesulfovibrionales bacterium]|nr:ribonuclease H-like domain-containing protein [Thermodesulfovibrionales bacterium]MCL0084619.1 ribonuclease H-like domain-containing protein [Thermodesulfovibrionales bacterium]MCL0086996.1 ribonuclease H-like domain-containing protein [Thermodesulfovibrionales bacterium]